MYSPSELPKLVYLASSPASNSTNTPFRLQYSLYGHIKALALAEKKGIEAAGGTADIFQIPESLPEDVLTKMHAPPKDADIPTLDDPEKLLEYDGFLFGIPTRYGNFPAQWKVRCSPPYCHQFSDSQLLTTSPQIFWDKTGGIWAKGGFWGKKAGLFISTGTPGGGQESTALAAISTLTHHGISFVPLGYGKAFPILADVSEVRGGSPWGAGTFAGADGSRQPTEKEIQLATLQGETFFGTFSK